MGAETAKPTPFSGSRYDENEARCESPATPCALCGRAVKQPWPASVHVVDGGASFATREQVEGKAPIELAGDMGGFPVGLDCARRLRAAGVYVVTGEGGSTGEGLGPEPQAATITGGSTT